MTRKLQQWERESRINIRSWWKQLQPVIERHDDVKEYSGIRNNGRSIFVEKNLEFQLLIEASEISDDCRFMYSRIINPFSSKSKKHKGYEDLQNLEFAQSVSDNVVKCARIKGFQSLVTGSDFYFSITHKPSLFFQKQRGVPEDFERYFRLVQTAENILDIQIENIRDNIIRPYNYFIVENNEIDKSCYKNPEDMKFLKLVNSYFPIDLSEVEGVMQTRYELKERDFGNNFLRTRLEEFLHHSFDEYDNEIISVAEFLGVKE